MTLQSEDMGKLVALSDLSSFPGGPPVFKLGDEVTEVGTFGVANCLVEVRHSDGRSGTWARSCFRPAHSEAQPESDGGGAADDAAGFLHRVSGVPQTDIDLEYLATNVLYGRGSLAKETKREAVVAIKTLRAILNDARRLSALHPTPEGQTVGAVEPEAIKHLRAMSHVAHRSFEVEAEAAFDFLARHDAALASKGV